MIWEPFVLALVLGLIVSAGLYFAYLWPSVEPLDDGEPVQASSLEPALAAAHSGQARQLLDKEAIATAPGTAKAVARKGRPDPDVARTDAPAELAREEEDEPERAVKDVGAKPKDVEPKGGAEAKGVATKDAAKSDGGPTRTSAGAAASSDIVNAAAKSEVGTKPEEVTSKEAAEDVANRAPYAGQQADVAGEAKAEHATGTAQKAVSDSTDVRDPKTDEVSS